MSLHPYAIHKPEPQSRACLFLSYSLTYSAFLCLDMSNNRVFVSHYVQTVEIEFSYSSFLHASSTSPSDTVLIASSWLYVPQLPFPNSLVPRYLRSMPLVTTYVSLLAKPTRVPHVVTPTGSVPPYAIDHCADSTQASIAHTPLELSPAAPVTHMTFSVAPHH